MNTKQPFAARAHLVLIGLLGLSFVLLMQQYNKGVYQAGFLLLIVTRPAQIIFGNIPSTAAFKQTLRYLIIGIVILGGVFVLGIVLTPTLVI